ncbi:MAG: prepilin-type N-terminal cleavage/methylation domain-containing protein [Planctomycetes bacterium]|nr:prepilin-type N-terminal cleavage/methylation domain-containing protein [Planctomycetota bacterium]
MPCPTNQRRPAFTLIELLVTLSIIALLIGILLPVLANARARARVTECSAQLKQLGLATGSYLNDYKEVFYWLGKSVDNEGMDWYVWGGTETVLNKSQNGVYPEGLFNHFKPRPLNPYVGTLNAFHCPGDTMRWFWSSAQGDSLFEWVGNSYQFNTVAYTSANTIGLAGVRLTQVRQPTHTVLYGDAALLQYYTDTKYWHPDHKGNVVFVDGHAEFMGFPWEGPDYTWNP